MAKRILQSGHEINVDPTREGTPVFSQQEINRVQVAKNSERPIASKRGYGKAWQDYVAVFLGKTSGRRVTCIACIETYADAWCVDHIIPVRQDQTRPDISGINDQVFFAPWNHQPLCRRHHTMKTLNHDRWYSDNRSYLLREIEVRLRKNTPEHEIRNWLIRANSMWMMGWFNLDSDPEQNYQLLS